MRYWTTLASAAFALAFGQDAHAAEGRLLDATGVEVPAGSTPARVVTLAPSLGELAADLLDERMDRIVGVTDYTDYPPALSKIASVGPYTGFNVEKVAALKPDLVVATTDGNRQDQVKRLRELGIRVVVVSTSTFAQIEQSIVIAGNALGVPARGLYLARRLREGVERIRTRAKAAQDRVQKVLLQVGSDPLVVAGGGSFLSEGLEIIGVVEGDSRRQDVAFPGVGRQFEPLELADDLCDPLASVKVSSGQGVLPAEQEAHEVRH